MSGHSKFANIKHKKEKNDAAKGKNLDRRAVVHYWKENDKPRVCILRHKIPNNKVKFIKIEAQPVEKLPEWHAAPGEKAWIMIDEIRVGS